MPALEWLEEGYKAAQIIYFLAVDIRVKLQEQDHSEAVNKPIPVEPIACVASPAVPTVPHQEIQNRNMISQNHKIL